MKEKLQKVFCFCIILKYYYCLRSDIYTLKPEYQNKSYQATPTFYKIGISLIQCSVYCTGNSDCDIIFFNKISGKCKAFQTITDENNLAYSENTDVFEKERDIAVITEAPISTTTRCPYVTSECGNSSYIKIVSTPDISPCFKVYTTIDRKSHANAKSFCQSENSRLIVLSDPNVYKLLSGYISCVYDAITQSVYFWIGLEYDPGQMKWVWFDSSSHATLTGNFTCGMMFKGGSIYAGDCPAPENFICEKL